MNKLFLFTCLFFSTFLFSQTLEGDWSGELSVSGSRLPLVFHFQQNQGVWSGTMDSPTQKMNGIPFSSIQVIENNVYLEIAMLNMKYQGNLIQSDSISGEFLQANLQLPLHLKKGIAVFKEPNRPQEPKKPFPYSEKEVTIKNVIDGNFLAGTLTLPKGKGPFPAVVLISGSGPQNRDEEIMGHKPFWIIADYLTRNGIAVLRYDDRGIGNSTGSFSTATSADFANDAEAVFQFLQKQKKINPSKVGLVGHSEGGLIAQIVAARNKQVENVIFLAAPGIDIDSLMLLQISAVNRSQQIPEEQTSQMLKNGRKVYDLLKSDLSTKDLKSALRIELEKQLQELTDEEQVEMRKQTESSIEMYASNWFRYFINYSPEKYLKDMKCRVLALNGENDIQVLYKENLMGIMNTLVDNGNKQVKIQFFPNLNHIFQTCSECTVAEYGELEETFNQEVLVEMLRFLQEK